MTNESNEEGSTVHIPFLVLCAASISHIFLITTTIFTFLLFLTASGTSMADAKAITQFLLLISGISTCIASTRIRFISPGVMCLYSPGFLGMGIFLLALKSGSLAILAGINILSGIGIILSGIVVTRIKSFIPTDIIGLIIFLTGFTLGIQTLPQTLLYNRTDAIPGYIDLVIITVTITVFIIVTVIQKNRFRPFNIFAAIFTGIICSIPAGIINIHTLFDFSRTPLFLLPIPPIILPQVGISALPGCIILIIAAVATTGAVVGLYEREASDTKEAFCYDRIGRGIILSGIATVTAGVSGGGYIGAHPQNAGLSVASNTFHRHIGYLTGIILICISCTPLFQSICFAIPVAVLAAVIICISMYLILTGISIMGSHLIDSDRSLILFIPAITGISIELIIHSFAPHSLLFSGSGIAIAVGCILSLALHHLFRLGEEGPHFLWDSENDDIGDIFIFIDMAIAPGSIKNAVIPKILAAVTESLETIQSEHLTKNLISIRITNRNDSVLVTIQYTGTEIVLPEEKPDISDFDADSNSFNLFSGYLVRHYASEVQICSHQEDCTLDLIFNIGEGEI